MASQINSESRIFKLQHHVLLLLLDTAYLLSSPTNRLILDYCIWVHQNLMSDWLKDTIFNIQVVINKNPSLVFLSLINYPSSIPTPTFCLITKSFISPTAMAAPIFHLPTSSSKPFSLAPTCLSSSSLSPNKVAKITMMFNKEAYWSKINDQVEAHIRSAVPLHTPPVVHRPMNDLVVAAPRTMAPALCIAAFDLVGGSDGQVDRAAVVAVAAGIHVMYAGSWAHQFLPNLLERSGPADHAANIELLSGDSIQPLGYEMAANSVAGSGSDVAAGRVVRVLVEMSRSMGAQGYTLGQYMHVMWARGQMKSDDKTMARQVSASKEGELYACGAVCGAVMAGAGEAEAERLRRFGRSIGTIHGLVGRSRKEAAGEIEEAVEELKASALMELQGFEVGKANVIASILERGCRPGGERDQTIVLEGNEHAGVM